MIEINNNLILVVGLITMVMSGIGANFEADTKKLVALSTLRQLGIIIIILGLGLPRLAFFHLVTHALFKSTLFMCAGFIIHSSERRQDSRHMSGFETARPNLAVGLLITNIALCGIPFLAGFFSKDIIVERMYSRDQGVWLCILSMAGVGATASYSTRLGYKIISKTRKFSPVGANLDFNPTVSNRTLILIAFRAIGGSILISIFY